VLLRVRVNYCICVCYFYFVIIILLFLNLVDLFYFYGLLDMGRFIITKRSLDYDNESSVAGSSLVISHILQLVLVLRSLCANIMKIIYPSDSFHF
jgi:hypothetical protein